MFAEEFVVLDADSPLWNGVQPLLNAALKLEQRNESYSWHGWKKASIDSFLQSLPAHCSLLLGVWDVDGSDGREEQEGQERETLIIGCVCEVCDGKVCSLCTFEALAHPDLSEIEQLEPGLAHALALLRAARTQVAEVAWALFTDKKTWDEWLLAEHDGVVMDKGDLLATFAREGRCVLMGSQTAHHRM